MFQKKNKANCETRRSYRHRPLGELTPWGRCSNTLGKVFVRLAALSAKSFLARARSNSNKNNNYLLEYYCMDYSVQIICTEIEYFYTYQISVQ